jgi:hypothetical protein
MNQVTRLSAAVPSRLVKEIRTIRTSLLSDALGKGGAMDHDMQFSPTAACRPRGDGASTRRTSGITCPMSKGEAGHRRTRRTNTALWGDTTRRPFDCRVVIIRDLQDSSDKFPFARAVVPNAGGVRWRVSGPGQCGGAIVHPGDWVVGDEDGVVVVPQDRFESVIEAAKRLAVVEKKIEDEVAKGKDLATLLRYHELLEKKTSEGVLPQMRFLEKGKG